MRATVRWWQKSRPLPRLWWKPEQVGWVTDLTAGWVGSGMTVCCLGAGVIGDKLATTLRVGASPCSHSAQNMTKCILDEYVEQ